MAQGFRNLDRPPAGLPNLHPLTSQWLQRAQDVVSNIMRGKINAVLPGVTLTPGSATTTVQSPLLSGSSWIGFCPLTPSARAELASAGGVHVSARGAGTLTLTHVNSATADRTFDLLIIG